MKGSFMSEADAQVPSSDSTARANHVHIPQPQLIADDSDTEPEQGAPLNKTMQVQQTNGNHATALFIQRKVAKIITQTEMQAVKLDESDVEADGKSA